MKCGGVFPSVEDNINYTHPFDPMVVTFLLMAGCSSVALYSLLGCLYFDFSIETMTMWTVLLCCLSLVGGYYLRAKVYPRATPKEL